MTKIARANLGFVAAIAATTCQQSGLQGTEQLDGANRERDLDPDVLGVALKNLAAAYSNVRGQMQKILHTIGRHDQSLGQDALAKAIDLMDFTELEDALHNLLPNETHASLFALMLATFRDRYRELSACSS